MLPTPQQEIRPEEEEVLLQLMQLQVMRLEELEMHHQQEIRPEVVVMQLLVMRLEEVEQELAIRQHQLSLLVPLT